MPCRFTQTDPASSPAATSSPRSGSVVHTDFGLGASVWGERDHALAVGRRIRSGALFVNAMVASDPRLPFGGTGRSGYGRELSAEGVREFTNVRTVVVA